MSDDLIISDDDRPAPPAPESKKDSITETITVPFSADIPKSKHAKILRQLATCLHAVLANGMRYAAIGDGNNAGAGSQIYQQTYQAAANLDAAATMLEMGQRAVIDPSRLPPPPGMGRA